MSKMGVQVSSVTPIHIYAGRGLFGMVAGLPPQSERRRVRFPRSAPNYLKIMDADLLNFILTAIVGIMLIPVIFIGSIYLFELWYTKKKDKSGLPK